MVIFDELEQLKLQMNALNMGLADFAEYKPTIEHFKEHLKKGSRGEKTLQMTNDKARAMRQVDEFL